MTDLHRHHSALNARDDLLAVADAWPDLLDRLAREGRANGERSCGGVGHSRMLALRDDVALAYERLGPPGAILPQRHSKTSGR